MKTEISFLQLSILTLLGGATIIGFYVGRLSNRINLPTIIGYMALGIILGPWILNIFEKGIIQQLSFVSEIGLGFVAFTIGSELSLASLKRMGPGIVSIIFASSLIAFLVVGIPIYVLILDLPLSIIFGEAIGIVFSRLVAKLHNSRGVLNIIFGVVLLATDLSIRWHLSFILTNMMVGFVLLNTQPEAVIRRVRTSFD